MGDLLIRNMDDDLRRRLHDQARQNGRTPAEEASVLLDASLQAGPAGDMPAGDWLRDLIGISSPHWTDEELAAIEASRHEPDRQPPKLDE